MEITFESRNCNKKSDNQVFKKQKPFPNNSFPINANPNDNDDDDDATVLFPNKLATVQEHEYKNDHAVRLFGIILIHRKEISNYLMLLPETNPPPMATLTLFNWWNSIYQDFGDPNIIIPLPTNANYLESKYLPNPNNLNQVPNSVQFVIRCWELYIWPNYEKSLTIWKKEYKLKPKDCGSKFYNSKSFSEENTWLALLYFMDLEVNGFFSNYIFKQQSKNQYQIIKPTTNVTSKCLLSKRAHNESSLLSSLDTSVHTLLQGTTQYLSLLQQSQQNLKNLTNDFITAEEQTSPISEIIRRQSQYGKILKDNQLNPICKKTILDSIQRAIKNETNQARKRYKQDTQED